MRVVGGAGGVYYVMCACVFGELSKCWCVVLLSVSSFLVKISSCKVESEVFFVSSCVIVWLRLLKFRLRTCRFFRSFWCVMVKLEVLVSWFLDR